MEQSVQNFRKLRSLVCISSWYQQLTESLWKLRYVLSRLLTNYKRKEIDPVRLLVTELSHLDLQFAKPLFRSAGRVERIKGLYKFRVSYRHYENTPIQIYWEFFHQKIENFQMKNSNIFHISAQNIDCVYSLEPPRRGGSNEYPQSMFWAEIWKITYTPGNPSFTI